MAGRHRKPISLREKAVKYVAGIAVVGITAYGVFPSPGTSAPSLPVVPTSTEVAEPAPELAAAATPTPTSSSTPIGPDRASEGSLSAPVTQDQQQPIQSPQPLPSRPVESDSQTPFEAESESLSERQADPRIVEAQPNQTCQPQSGLAVQRFVALATADIVSRFDFGGILGGRGPRSFGTSDHPNGLATDFMTTNVELGNSIRDYVLKNKERLGIKYVIWRQRYYTSLGTGRLMDDRGSSTQNHYDHVHVSFSDPGPEFAPRCD